MAIEQQETVTGADAPVVSMTSRAADKLKEVIAKQGRDDLAHVLPVQHLVPREVLQRAVQAALLVPEGLAQGLDAQVELVARTQLRLRLRAGDARTAAETT